MTHDLAGDTRRLGSTTTTRKRSATSTIENDALDVEWLKRQKRFPAKAEHRGIVVTEDGSY